MPTVISERIGRLGNQILQIAASIGYADKYGIDWAVTPHSVSPKHFPNYVFPKELPVLKGTGEVSAQVIRENGHEFNLLPPPERDLIILNGYWQSPRYFSHCREKVLDAFGFPYKKIENTVSVHVRVGDYVLYPDKHPVITNEYIYQSLFYLKNLNKFDKVVVFSDDIPYCKKIFEPFRQENWNIEYSEGRTEIEDLIYMSNCTHNIIANSTFSWWGAYLNQNPDKIVISPTAEEWFGPGNKHLNTKDLLPDGWLTFPQKMKYE